MAQHVRGSIEDISSPLSNIFSYMFTWSTHNDFFEVISAYIASADRPAKISFCYWIGSAQCMVQHVRGSIENISPTLSFIVPYSFTRGSHNDIISSPYKSMIPKVFVSLVSICDSNCVYSGCRRQSLVPSAH